MHRVMVCITCPMGCEMEVVVDGDDISVSNNRCKRGTEYAREEIIAPKRMVTAVVQADSSDLRRLPVKTERPVAKELTMQVAARIHELKVSAPISLGQVIHDDIDGNGTRLVATRELL